MANRKETMEFEKTRAYKRAEIKARSTSRDNTIERISEYMERDFVNDTHKDLVEEIIYMRTNGCRPLCEYSDDELVEELIDHIDRYAEINGEQL